MSLLRAIRVHAAELSTDRAKSFADLRHCLSHANVFSTTLDAAEPEIHSGVGLLDYPEHPVPAGLSVVLKLIPA